jgi:hypothetical protein
VNDTGYRRQEHKTCWFNCVHYMPVPLCTSVSKSNTGESTVRRGERKGEEGVIYGIILMDSFAGSAVLE